MRWPWKRNHVDGEARRAIREAIDREIQAHKKTPEVDRKVRAAEALAQRGDLFAREVERSWHLKRGSA